MSPSPESLPNQEQEAALHARLVAMDPTAPADLATIYLTPLINWLANRCPYATEELRTEAAEDAIMNLNKNPATYKSSMRKTLWGYLRMSAAGDLLNQLRKESRHHEHREYVELSEVDGNHSRKDVDPQVDEQVEVARAKILPIVRDGLSDAELRVLELYLNGEKKTAVLAQAYGIGDSPRDEQQAQMKKLTDKFKKRIERARKDYE